MEQYKLPDVVVEILNARLQDEYNAERFYKNASKWCDLNGWKVASDFFVCEMHDEHSHAHKIERHATDWNVQLPSPTVDMAGTEYNSYVAIIQAAYEMEYALYQAYCRDIQAIDEDYPQTEIFLQKFVKIQNEAVYTYSEMLKRCEGISTNFELRQMEKKIFKIK